MKVDFQGGMTEYYNDLKNNLLLIKIINPSTVFNMFGFSSTLAYI